MKKLVTFICLFWTVSTYGQVFYSETAEDYTFNKMQFDKSKKQISENHISAIQIFKCKPAKGNIDRKGVLNYESKYNDKGCAVEHNEYNRKGKLKLHYAYKWDEGGNLLESVKYNASGKFLNKVAYTYDKDGNETDMRWYWKNQDKPLSHTVNKYDDKHNLLETCFLYKNDKRKGDRYVFTYYADGSKQQTIHYSRKGKALHTWNYECKPEGTLDVQKLKDTSKMCVRYELDKNGNKIKVVEEVARKGKVVRIIHKYSKDNNLLDAAEYNADGKAIKHAKYDYDSRSRMIEIIAYAKKSNEAKKRWVYQYDDNDNLTNAAIYKNGKDLNHTLRYTYIKR